MTEIPVTQTDGTGTPVILVHGWLGSRDSWAQVLPELGIENPVITYDQRCHGTAPCEPFDMHNLATDLQTVIERHCDDPPIVVGHSMGGMVALTHASAHPVAGMVLIGTCADTPEPRDGSPRFFLEQFDSMPRSEWAARIAENYVPDGPTELRDMAREELRNAPEEPIRYGLEAMIDHDVTDTLQDISAPRTVIAGRDDAAITPEKSRDLAAGLDCDITWMDTGHLMLQEAPKEVAAVIRDTVRRWQR